MIPEFAESSALKDLIVQDVKLEYYASDVLSRMGYSNEKEIEKILSRTFQIFAALKLSAKKNFKQVFRYRDREMVIDWKLSRLACYLLILNGEPSNPNTGKAQLFYCLQKGSKRILHEQFI